MTRIVHREAPREVGAVPVLKGMLNRIISANTPTAMRSSMRSMPIEGCDGDAGSISPNHLASGASKSATLAASVSVVLQLSPAPVPLLQRPVAARRPVASGDFFRRIRAERCRSIRCPPRPPFFQRIRATGLIFGQLLSQT